jgi:hypothetical protein
VEKNNLIPKSSNSVIKNQIKSIIPVILSFPLFISLPVMAQQLKDGYYVDNEQKFALTLPPSWFAMQTKVTVPKLTQYLSEDILFSASSFTEGSSLSITKTNSVRLLKDFDIDWWFSPLNSISDVGSAELVAKLLILQRQSEFEKKITNSEITNASIVDNNTLLFSFNTPLAEGIYRSTIAKAVFNRSYLTVIWISSLSSVMESDYGKTLEEIRKSFVLIA